MTLLDIEEKKRRIEKKKELPLAWKQLNDEGIDREEIDKLLPLE